MTGLKILSVVIFNSSDLYGIAMAVLYIAGLWMIFRKCGTASWKALIPWYREYVLGECAGREPEGRVAAVLELLMMPVNILSVLSKNLENLNLLAMFLLLLLAITDVIYLIRIYVGLTEVFNRKKKWCLLWVLSEGLCAFLWGLLNSFQPQWQIKDMRKTVETYFQGSNIAVLDDGLTVNLTERTKTASFQKVYLLRDIHLYIKPGRMVLLLGGSGAGKTTFVNAINGYEKAKAEVMLNGSNVYKDYDKMKYEVGFVPQLDLMRGNDTVLRTLMDASALRLPVEFKPSERRKRVDEVMGIFGLVPVKDSLVEKLSGGQRKRLSIAMEFISNPSLFILDEPDSGLDGVMARELMAQLRGIADQGKIVIVITHTPDRVIDLFDDVIVLAKDENLTGRLAFFGEIDEARAFFGKEDMEEIVKSINRPEEGGEGRADEFIKKYAEAHHG